MRNYLFTISEEERNNILDKHKTLYDGYAVRQSNPKEQPLYVQDFANDKEGITINSRGEVSTYNNKIYMKESKNICSECGLYEEVCECGKGGMYEAECSECGGMMTEGECSECGYKSVKGVGDKFDYVEEFSEGERDQDIALAFGAEDNAEDQDIALAMDEELGEDFDNIKKGLKKFGRGALSVGLGLAGIPTYDHTDEKGDWKKDRAGKDYDMFSYSQKQGADLEDEPKNIDKIMDEIASEIEFEEETEDIKESINESINWFKRFKNYN